jgi:hypothetical protein
VPAASQPPSLASPPAWLSSGVAADRPTTRAIRHKHPLNTVDEPVRLLHDHEMRIPCHA